MALSINFYRMCLNLGCARDLTAHDAPPLTATATVMSDATTRSRKRRRVAPSRQRSIVLPQPRAVSAHDSGLHAIATTPAAAHAMPLQTQYAL